MGSMSVAAAALLLTFLSVCHGDPEVTTGQGTLRGSTMTTNHGRNITAFRRIPFAQPPIGELRFKNPVAAGSWKGTLDATKRSPSCPQVLGESVMGDEDCLYLDVYTPQVPDDANTSLLPVMVFIFGGGYQMGSIRMLEPGYIMDKDVILVFPNYRLGVLGFLSTGDSEAPGNFGLKDQVQALRWVKENAKYFGGDSNNVTVFGQSAGAGSIQLMTLSDLTNGLFHKFILQSGAFAYKKSSVYATYAKKLAEHLACPTNTSFSLIACLREINVSTIVNTLSIFHEWEGNPDLVWLPTDEPDVEGAFLTDNPGSLIAAGKMKDLPCIVGATRDEGFLMASFLINETKFDALMNELDNALPYLLRYYDDIDEVANFTAALKEFYFNDLSANRSVLQSNFTDLISDMLFLHPLDYWIREQLSAVKSPFYVYSFEYRGTFGMSYLYTGRNDSNFGVAHGDDTIYFFPLSKSPLFNTEMSKDDMEMVDSMVQLWTSFAITGIPTPLAANGAIDWEPYSLHKTHLRIGSDSNTSLAVEPPKHVARMEFWRESEKTFHTIP